MLRVSRLTDYATLVMSCLAAAPEEVTSAQVLAERAHLEVPTVSKLLKLLAQHGLVVSTRGSNGGYSLARGAAEISVNDIVTAIEGPVGMTECTTPGGRCELQPWCGTRVNWQRINRAIVAALESVSLADMAAPAARHEAAQPIPLRAAAS